MDFTEKVFAITGGASGIGLETARHLLAAGAKVAVLDISEGELENAKEALDRSGDRLLAIVADTADTPSMTQAVSKVVESFGCLDGLVANAGIRMQSVPLAQLDDEIWDNLIRVNLRGVFVACRAAAPHLIKGTSGSIVTVSSLSGRVARLDQSAYCASKAGVIQLSRALALELAENNIRVNCVCPGTVETAMLKKAQDQDGANILQDRIYGSPSRFRSGIPLRRVGQPGEVAETIAFLLSSGARHITGQTIFIDGGESII